AGYAQIGLDHFARADDPLAAAAAAGQLHRNFQGYTTDAAETLIGLGPSAIGALPQGYVQNDPGFRAWSDHVAAGRLPIARWRGLIEDDRRRRAVIERLMCDGRVDLDRFGGWSGFPEARDRLDRMVEAGLVEIDASGVTVTDFGRPFLRAAASAFDRYLGLGTAQHSSGV
ncbi:MAG: coproporphyrinogen III oxidase, partial [Ferrovibrionaceae bacterium]